MTRHLFVLWSPSAVCFFVNGAIYGTWATQVPIAKERLALGLPFRSIATGNGGGRHKRYDRERLAHPPLRNCKTDNLRSGGIPALGDRTCNRRDACLLRLRLVCLRCFGRDD